MQFGVRFFDLLHPHLVSLGAVREAGVLGAAFYRNSLIDDDVDPFEVFEESEAVDALSAEFMENGRENTIRAVHGELLVYDHALYRVDTRYLTEIEEADHDVTDLLFYSLLGGRPTTIEL